MSKFVTFTVDGEKWAINIAHIICVQSSSKGNGIVWFVPVNGGNMAKLDTGMPFEEVMKLLEE